MKEDLTSNSQLDARIREALVYTFPVHDVAQARWQFTQNRTDTHGAPPNALFHYRRLLDHRARAVTTPNNDTLYSIAWLDLSGGPLLLSLPDMRDRYYSFAFLDIFTNNVACIGRRTTGTAAASFLLAGPGWQGEAPAGAHVLRLPCHDIWALGRVLVDGEADLDAVHALQDAMRLEPLAGGQAQQARLLQAAPDERDPERYLDLVNEVLGRNPIPANEQALVQGMADLGVRPGTVGAWRELDDTVRAAWAGHHAANLAALARTPSGTTLRNREGGSWTSGADHLGNFGDDYAYRAFVSLVGLGALEREEAIYATAMIDADGEMLDGRHGYRLHIPADLPIDAFWSLSMYELEPDGRRFFVDNPLHRYTLGDRTPGVARAADGSMDIQIQHAAPASDRQANWLPAPAGRFSLTLRFYQPRRALLDRSFVMPDVERLDQPA
ncbi:DUF1254 domain-containing protein [Cupriavidus sp. TMH.W2]|uniref:DUF1254 domain-containing protein n=1 Tax=Cupriavidus sp. TMH.W2 TaxID=3434465 RepID=UPI003D78364D